MPHSWTGRSRGATATRRALSLLSILAVLALSACTRPTRSTQIAYSALKQRVAAGDVSEMRLSPTMLEAVPTSAAREAGAPDLWVAVPVPADQDLVPLLDAHGVTYQGMKPTTGITPGVLVALLLVLALAAIVAIRLGKLNPSRGLSALVRSRGRVRDVQARSTTRFHDVAGVDEAQEELEEIVRFLRQPARFSALGARVPKGVLLVGPPGTGKTLLARAVAGEANVPFFPVSGSDFIEMFVGIGASRVRQLFDRAKSRAPAIVFIDELDAIGKSRSGATGNGASDEREHTLNQLLVEMDGFDPHDGLIVIGATNRAETLDPALLRPGRFDRQVLVDRPDWTGREAILQVHARRLKLDADVNLTHIARRTPGFAGADLENLLNEAALLAARADKTAVGMVELDAAIDRVVAGLERKHRRVSDKERRIVAYHEAGHAIVSELAPMAEPVRRVSIVPRGNAALGYTQQSAEDRYLMQEDELMDGLAVLLGGRAAEHLVFGQLSTGASNDLERATALARRMVCEFGMSAAVGPVAFVRQESRGRRAGDEAPGWSEESAARIEDEVKALLSRAFERACDALNARRHTLDAVAGALLERGTLDREELVALMAAA